MANCLPDSCEICIYPFNETDRKAIALSCSHSFCLTCLLYLQDANNQICPLCRQNFDDTKLSPLPGMKTASAPLNVDKSEPDDLKKKFVPKKVDIMCKEHDLCCWFWCDHCKEFSCKKCVTVKQNTCSFELISEAIPKMTLDLSHRIQITNNHIDDDLYTLDTVSKVVNEELSHIRGLKEAVLRLEPLFAAYVHEIDAVRAKRRNEKDASKAVETNISKIVSEDQISLVEECKETIANLQKAVIIPEFTESSTLLRHIACSYMLSSAEECAKDKKDCMEENQGDMEDVTKKEEEALCQAHTEETPRAPSSQAFMSRLLHLPAISVLRDITQVAASFTAGKSWIVDNSNWIPAVCAMAVKQPSILRFIIRHG